MFCFQNNGIPYPKWIFMYLTFTLQFLNKVMVISYVRFLKISIVVINGPKSRIVGSLQLNYITPCLSLGFYENPHKEKKKTNNTNKL